MTDESDLKDFPKCASKKRKNNQSLECFKKDDGEQQYPYEVADDDHCETPLQAYEHIKSLLCGVATALNKSIADLIIYDPFYCEGSVVERLRTIGFESVYNVLEDFYIVHSENRLPVYDVIVTNPPYSGSNMEKILRICATQSKPWFLLLPNYVYTKDYYMPILKLNRTPVFYIVPVKGRYLYTTPKGRRQGKSSKYTAPFPTFWYCNLTVFSKKQNITNGLVNHVALVWSERDIPLESAPDNDPRKKKLRNSLKRIKNKNRKKKMENK